MTYRFRLSYDKLEVTLRIMVSGRFEEYPRVRAFMDSLRHDGHVITHDWTRTDQFDSNGVLREDWLELTREQKQQHACDDLRGVRTADLVIVLGDSPQCGSIIEIGAALILGIPVWIVEPWRDCLFWSHPLVRCVTTEREVWPQLRQEVGSC